MTTTTISPSLSARMFHATSLVALVLAVVALTLALANRPATVSSGTPTVVHPVPSASASSFASLGKHKDLNN